MSLYIAIPIPTPDRWRFLRDPAELPPGYVIIIAAAARRFDALESIAASEAADDQSSERAVFVFLAHRRKGAPPEPVVTETKELAEIMRGRCSEVVEVRLTVRAAP